MRPDSNPYQTFLDLHRAILAIGDAADLSAVLQRIVDAARALLDARYAALGVAGQDGRLDLFIHSGLTDAEAAAIAHPPEGKGLLGAIIADGTPLRLARITDEPRASGFPPGHPPMTTFLGVPITSGGETWGNLYLTERRDGHPFTAEDQALIQLFAAHAAGAIRNARQAAAARRSSDRLAQQNRALAALNTAALAITQDLALENTLQHIVDAARELVDAEYAALGVPNAAGELEAFLFSGLAPDDVRALPQLPRGRGLLGAIIAERHPIRVPDIAADDRSVGFPPGHPPMSSFLGVPVWAEGEVLGNLYLTNKRGAPAFSADDEALVIQLAAHAAVAIHNARLYQQVEQLAVLEERTRIGMDLHDGVIQSIYAVGLALESARLSLPAGTEEAQSLLDLAATGLNDAIKDIRNFILDLRPRRFDGDLVNGIGKLVREFQANLMVPVTLDSPGRITGLPVAAQRALFLTTQESLANVARHARAGVVAVILRQAPDGVELTIADDGQGFDPAARTARIGHGLANMQARAAQWGGRLRIDSRPGAGTTITMHLPLPSRGGERTRPRSLTANQADDGV